MARPRCAGPAALAANGFRSWQSEPHKGQIQIGMAGENKISKHRGDARRRKAIRKWKGSIHSGCQQGRGITPFMNSIWVRYLPAYVRNSLYGRDNLQKLIANTGWLFADRTLRMA